MDLNTFTWFAVCLVLGLAALAVTVHVASTDEGLAHIRTMLRRRHDRRTERSTPTLEGHHHHEHDSH